MNLNIFYYKIYSASHLRDISLMKDASDEIIVYSFSEFQEIRTLFSFSKSYSRQKQYTSIMKLGMYVRRYSRSTKGQFNLIRYQKQIQQPLNDRLQFKGLMLWEFQQLYLRYSPVLQEDNTLFTTIRESWWSRVPFANILKDFLGFFIQAP